MVLSEVIWFRQVGHSNLQLSPMRFRSTTSAGALGCLFAALIFLCLPVDVRAQGNSAISGVVTDSTGGVLPGVTVEVRSPALIGEARTAVTNDQGRYSVLDLGPGTYKVTFTLSGFSPVVRDGIQLQANFTAPLNIQMKVGEVAETITVSGASPVVDVQRTERREVVDAELVSALPTGRSFSTIGNTIPALAQQGAGAGSVNGSMFDVGGSSTMWQAELHVYAGPAPQSTQVDGMRIDSFVNTGVVAMYGNSGAFQEFVYQTNAGTAETPYGNVVVNQIPYSGGNTIHILGVGNWANSSMAASNASPTQLTAGFQLQTQPKLDKEYDFNPSIGFPLLKDRLWWFSSFRAWTYNATTGALSDGFDSPAGTPEVDRNLHRAFTNHVTWAPTPKNRVSAYGEWIRFERFGTGSPTASTEATTVYNDTLDYFAIGKWTYTPTSKLYVDTGYAINHKGWTNTYRPGVPTTAPAKLDTVTGYSSSNVSSAFNQPVIKQFYNGSVTYITGAHTLKFGFQGGYGTDSLYRYSLNGGLLQQYRSGVPFAVVIYDTPINSEVSGLETGLFAQDSWTFKRVTLNPGVRWDAYKGTIGAISAPASTFLPTRNFAQVSGLPNWKDASLRFGASFDVFGNGKTALKGSIGKYDQGQTAAASFITPYNPVSSGITLISDTRNWTDLNHDDIAEPNEIGPSNNPGFGVAVNRALDPTVSRPYDLLYNIAVDQQLMSGLGVSVAYNRRDSRNLLYTQNLANPLATDWQLLSLADPRGNGQVLPVYQVLPADVKAVSQVDLTSANNSRAYNGVDVLFHGRLKNGILFTAGTSTGRLITKTCDVANPNSLRFCDLSQFSVPYLTTVKLSGTYPLPWAGLRLSAFFLTQPGPEQTFTYVVTKAQLPQLTTASSVSIPLTEPGSTFLPRVYQTDLSLGWTAKVNKLRLKPALELFNLFNANNVLTQTTVYPTQGKPLTILPGRLFRISVTVDY
jgi:hypothetical protein